MDTACLYGCYGMVCAAGQMQLQELLVCIQANCYALCAMDPSGFGCLGCVGSNCGAQAMACGTTC